MISFSNNLILKQTKPQTYFASVGAHSLFHYLTCTHNIPPSQAQGIKINTPPASLDDSEKSRDPRTGSNTELVRLPVK